MDTFTALSIAATIFQIVQFSVAILSRSKEIYGSASGSLNYNVDLELVEEDLAGLISKLVNSIVPGGTGPASSDDDQTLLALCHRSVEISRELKNALQKVRMNGPKSKFKSIRKALRSVYDKKEIDSLKERLFAIRSELDTHILIELPSRIDFLMLKQSEHFEKQSIETQNLINVVLDSQHNLSVELNDHSSRITTAILTTRSVVQEATERSDAGHAGTQIKLDQLKATGGRAFDEFSRFSVDTLRAIEDLKATCKLELERQLRPIQERIAELIRDKNELEGNIKDAVPKINSEEGSTEEQKELQHQVNIWIQIWVAKGIVLQKLLELVAIIKLRLANLDWLPRFPSFDLRDEEMIKIPASKSSTQDAQLDVITMEQCRMLIAFIEAGNITLCKSFIAREVINRRLPRTVDLSLLASNYRAQRFYSLIYPRARLGRDWNGRPATPLESAMLASSATLAYSMPLVQMDLTPLIFTVQQIGLLLLSCEAEGKKAKGKGKGKGKPAGEKPEDAVRKIREELEELDIGAAQASTLPQTGTKDGGSSSQAQSRLPIPVESSSSDERPTKYVDPAEYDSSKTILRLDSPGSEEVYGTHGIERETPLDVRQATKIDETSAATEGQLLSGVDKAPNTRSFSRSRDRQVKNLLQIMDILIASGADLRVLDNAGLSAYDHARILGLEDAAVSKLRPPNIFDGETIPMPRATHPHRFVLSGARAVPADLPKRPSRLITVQRINFNGSTLVSTPT